MNEWLGKVIKGATKRKTKIVVKKHVIVKCRACGEQNSKQAQFCSACGEPLGPAEESS